MRSIWLHVLSICTALVLAACGGSGAQEEGDPAAGTPPPATPTPTPSPSPPPSASNRAPEANAGEDKTTVEEQDVTVDGSRTRDPEEDPLTYSWQLVSAPDGSSISVSADTATFVFRPDLPGSYQLQLTASDGQKTSTDTMRVTSQPLLTFNDSVSFKVDRKGKENEARRELRLRTSALYRGEPVAFTATPNVPWLRVLQPSGTSADAGGTVSVTVELIMDEVRMLPSGDHEARVIVAPSGGWEQANGVVELELEQDGDRSIVPYVTYAGKTSRVTLYADDLRDADGELVFMNGTAVSTLGVTGTELATTELPPLSVGVYTLQIGISREVARDIGRVVVREQPVHRATELALPGVARSLEYDAERDAFYAVFLAPDGTRIARRLQNSGMGEWVAQSIPVAAPRAVALSADGADLLVTADGCTVHRLEPQTLGILQSLTKSSCDQTTDRFDTLATLADGRVLAVGDMSDAGIWQYPDLTLVAMPRQATPLLVLNADRERLTWADQSDARAVLDLGANTLWAFRSSSGSVQGIPLPSDVQEGSRTFVPPSGTAAFAFTVNRASETRYRLYVRELQEGVQ